MITWFGKLLGLDNVASIEDVQFSLSAAWAQFSSAGAWLFFFFVGIAVACFYYYLRLHNRGNRAARGFLAILRAVMLCLLILILAEPVVVFRLFSEPKPQLWVLFDGTDSMAIEDELSGSQRAALEDLLEPPSEATSPGLEGVAPNPDETVRRPRIDYVRRLFAGRPDNLLARLNEKFRLKTFVFDETVRELPDPSGWVGSDENANEKLTTTGQFTALGSAFRELSRRQATSDLAGLLVVSDFDQNSGPVATEAAQRFGVPVFTVGVGPAAVKDVRIALDAPVLMKKAERTTVNVAIEHEGTEADLAALRPSVQVRVLARPLGTDRDDASEVIEIGTKTVELTSNRVHEEFPFVPEVIGRYTLEAEVEPLEGEVVEQNNRAERPVNIRDDFLRLMYVEYEPTWEWRFVKEVFHRDRLVGMRGFRTFLRSADPNVREENELFLPTMTPSRAEFFANDVIFLGDMPAATLSTRFCEMVEEFVSKFGGGLVVVSGPRFGPGQLQNTPLANMLPVVVDPDARLRDQREFNFQLTYEAEITDFMRLGETDEENEKAWGLLDRVPWYQPVARMHSQGRALAVHPYDMCDDGQTPQPLIAIRRYGKGEVVYVAANETWRLRRKYGEEYYRQFWGQMIHRLGLSHALGDQKRFVVSTDRQQYKADEKVILTVEAYDSNYQPLEDEKIPDGALLAEVVVPGQAQDGSEQLQRYPVGRVREGVFEARVPVDVGGEYRVRVRDPITAELSEVRFQVTDLSAERRSAVRNVALQREISATTGGKTADLVDAAQLVDEIDLTSRSETSIRVIPIWNTWPCFLLVLALMLGEWLGRKWMSLP